MNVNTEIAALRGKRSLRSFQAGAAIIALGIPVFAYGLWQYFGWISLVFLCGGASVWAIGLGVLATLQGSLSVRLGSLYTVLVLAPMYPISWINHHVMASSSILWAPFIGIKLFVVCLVFLVPGTYWVSLALISGFAVETVALWVDLDLYHSPAAVVAAEPWLSLVFFGVCAAVLAFRWRSENLEYRLVAAEARGDVLARVARLTLRVRDQGNTPLQNLVIGAELLSKFPDHPEEILANMHRSIERLRDVRDAMNRFEKLVNWTGDELEADDELDLWLEEFDTRNPGKAP